MEELAANFTAEPEMIKNEAIVRNDEAKALLADAGILERAAGSPTNGELQGEGGVI